MLSRTAFFSLYNNYHKLEKEANELEDKVSEAEMAKVAAQEEALKQEKRKKGWRGVAIGQGVGIVGAIALAILFL
jgi:hypothetical protein